MKVGIWDETAEMEPWEDRERCRGLVAAWPTQTWKCQRKKSKMILQSKSIWNKTLKYLNAIITIIIFWLQDITPYACIYLIAVHKLYWQNEISLRPVLSLFWPQHVLYFLVKLFWPQYFSYCFESDICSTFLNSQFYVYIIFHVTFVTYYSFLTCQSATFHYDL
jgi:hypothetical protein